jgi:hypothetical protein
MNRSTVLSDSKPKQHRSRGPSGVEKVVAVSEHKRYCIATNTVLGEPITPIVQNFRLPTGRPRVSISSQSAERLELEKSQVCPYLFPTLLLPW